MKQYFSHLLLISCLFTSISISFAQTTLVFHENFELPGLADSVVSSQLTAGINDWGISTTLHHNGLRADSCKVNEGFSLDDFSLKPSTSQEVTLHQIVAPNSGCGLTLDTVKINIINSGNDIIHGGLTAFYQNGNGLVVSEPIADSIGVGDTLAYSFTTPADLTVNQWDSNFVIKAWVSLINDPDQTDDTLSKVITSKHLAPPAVISSVSIPYATSTLLTAVSGNSIQWFTAPVGGVLLASGPSYSTPILFNTTIYYLQTNAINGCQGPRTADTVFVENQPQFDGSLTSILSPNTGINLSSQEPVQIHIKNFGSLPISNYTVSYSLNNNQIVTEQILTSLDSGADTTYIFNQTADLSQYQSYFLRCWLNVPGDSMASNDTVKGIIVNSMFNYCPSSATHNHNVNIGKVTFSNLINGSATPITNNYSATSKYTDFTSINPAIVIRDLTYNISVSQINFSSYEEAYIKVFIDWNYDGVFNEATETAWNAGTTSYLPLQMTLNGSIHIPANANLGLTRMRVVLQQYGTSATVHACGTYDYGETEDYTILILDHIPFDAGVVSIDSPPPAYPTGFNIIPTVKIKNFGTSPISNFNVAYQTDNGIPVVQNYSQVLAPGAVAQVSFPAVIYSNGPHEFCAFTQVSGDTNFQNDTLCRQTIGVSVLSLPFSDNFDDSTHYFTAGSIDSTNWIKGTPSNFFPDTAHSLPNVWATNLNIGHYNNHAYCTLTSPTFNWVGIHNAFISFWYKMKTEQYYDGTHLEYSIDNGTTWEILGSQGDPLATNWYTNSIYTDQLPAWAGNQDTWERATRLLSDFNGQITMRFRFVFSSDASVVYEGMAIDDFKISTEYHDAGSMGIIIPNAAAMPNTPVNPVCAIKNYGNDTIQSIQISYKINNNPAVTETWTATPGNPLHLYDTANFTFSTPFNAPMGSYKLTIFTSLPNDENPLNDTTSKIIQGIYDCQMVTASYDDSQIFPPLDSGYMKSCLGDSIKLTGKGIYPQNNWAYTQSDQTSVFHWDFGDGDTATGQTVYHNYQNPGGYKVRLWIQEIGGCKSTVTTVARVLVSSNPITTIQPIPGYCTGIPHMVSLGYSDTNTIRLAPPQANPLITNMLIHDTPQFIPNGAIAPGYPIEIPINVNQFSNNNFITNNHDIKEVSLNIENSSASQLIFNLICPNGQSVVLKSAINQGEAFLGVPKGGINHEAYDCLIDPICIYSPVQNPPGTGWTYSWSTQATHDVMNNYTLGAQVDSGSYLPEESFNQLIGCPLNGQWRMQIFNHSAHDNGWAFWWSMQIDSSFLPIPTFPTLPYHPITWIGPNILQFTDNQMIAAPLSPGNNVYHIFITDHFGCTYDTAFYISASSAFQVDCGNDTNYLSPASSILTATVTGAIPPIQFLWSTGETTPSINVTTGVTTIYTVTVMDGTGCQSTDSVKITIGPIGINETDSQSPGLSVYPNPATSEMLLSFNMKKPGNIVYDIYNSLGQKIMTGRKDDLSAGKQNFKIDVSNFSPGVYMLNFNVAGKPELQKMVKVIVERN